MQYCNPIGGEVTTNTHTCTHTSAYPSESGKVKQMLLVFTAHSLFNLLFMSRTPPVFFKGPIPFPSLWSYVDVDHGSTERCVGSTLTSEASRWYFSILRIRTTAPPVLGLSCQCVSKTFICFGNSWQDIPASILVISWLAFLF